MAGRPDTSYRPDIDGLRALAVSTVVLYHADLAVFSGGFVGVDVFFVISGFLITKLVYDAACEGSFSFWSFFLRRARRLLPAALCTFAVSSALAAALMDQEHLKAYAASLFYASLALSNVHFWTQSGYFDTDASLKPLLHTWSLGVEEQFYLVWPAFIVVMARWPYARSLRALLVVVGLGFTAALHVVSVNAPAAFFLAPLRVWEFALGGLVLWGARVPLGKSVREWLTLAGIGMIAFSVFRYDAATLFPGPAAALPCAGAALCILAGDAPYAGLLLRNPISVFVGKTSYSFYLVHWPALVFCKYYSFAQLSGVQLLLVLLSSFGLACLMWRYVEEPFRHPRPAGSPRTSAAFLVGGAACVMTTLALAGYLWTSAGLERSSQAASRSVARYLNKQNDAIAALSRVNTCYITGRGRYDPATCIVIAAIKPNFLVFGDSYAAVAFAGMRRHFGDHVQLSLAAHAGCEPTLEPTTTGPDCDLQHELLFNQLDLRPFDMLFVIGAFHSEFSVARIRAATTRLSTRGARQIVVMGSPHSYMASVTATFTRLARFEPATIIAHLSSLVDPTFLDMDRRLSDADLGPAEYVSMVQVTCPARRPSACFHTLPGTGLPFIGDRNHLTADGAAWVFDVLATRDPPWSKALRVRGAETAPVANQTGERADDE